MCLWIFGRIRNRRHFLSKTVICRCSNVVQSFFFYFFHFLIHSIQNSEMKIFPSRKLRKVELEIGKKNLLQKMFLIHLEADFSFLQIFLHGPFLMWEFFNVIDLTCEICWTLKCCSTGKWSLENVKYQMINFKAFVRCSYVWNLEILSKGSLHHYRGNKYRFVSSSADFRRDVKCGLLTVLFI